MDINDLKNKSIKDLHELLFEKRDKLREFRFQAREGQLKNVREIRKAKTDIAQILTMINKDS